MFDALMVFLKEFFEKVDSEKKISRQQKSEKNFPGGQKVNERKGELPLSGNHTVTRV